MRFLDYFLLLVYRFAYSIRKDESVKFSARLFLSVYVWLLFLILYWGIGIVGNHYHMDREVFIFMNEYGEPISFIVSILIAILMNVVYIKYRHFSDIELSYDSLSKSKRTWVKIFIWIFIILMPVCAFICGRLFVKGYDNCFLD